MGMRGAACARQHGSGQKLPMELSPPRAESELRGRHGVAAAVQPTWPRSVLGGKVGEKRHGDRYYNSANATGRFHSRKKRSFFRRGNMDASDLASASYKRGSPLRPPIPLAVLDFEHRFSLAALILVASTTRVVNGED